MSSRSGFIAGLNKSTKITVCSCIGFILLTCIILVFFVMFPITPSEKIMASIGRENVINGGSGGSPQSISPGVVTTSANDDTESTAPATKKLVTTTARTVNIRITTGSGFLWNGRIPTGVVPGEDYPTTVVDDPAAPTPDPGPVEGGYPGIDPPVTTPVDPNPGVDVPPATTPVDPNPGGEDPPVVDPPVVDPPVVDPPVDDPNPPAVDPPPNENGGDPEPSPDPLV